MVRLAATGSLMELANRVPAIVPGTMEERKDKSKSPARRLYKWRLRGWSKVLAFGDSSLGSGLVVLTRRTRRKLVRPCDMLMYPIPGDCLAECIHDEHMLHTYGKLLIGSQAMGSCLCHIPRLSSS
jgi:hypothetical protein